jgi:hypothetical protein
MYGPYVLHKDRIITIELSTASFMHDCDREETKEMNDP